LIQDYYIKEASGLRPPESYNKEASGLRPTEISQRRPLASVLLINQENQGGPWPPSY